MARYFFHVRNRDLLTDQGGGNELGQQFFSLEESSVPRPIKNFYRNRHRSGALLHAGPGPGGASVPHCNQRHRWSIRDAFMAIRPQPKGRRASFGPTQR